MERERTRSLSQHGVLLSDHENLFIINETRVISFLGSDKAAAERLMRQDPVSPLNGTRAQSSQTLIGSDPTI